MSVVVDVVVSLFTTNVIPFLAQCQPWLDRLKMRAAPATTAPALDVFGNWMMPPFPTVARCLKLQNRLFRMIEVATWAP
jgi:hypothetical protein